MKVTFFSCGPVANESELKALAHLKSRLQAESGGDQWILLGNLAFSVTHQLQSDEIDIVVIGPPGVRVLEVKHWAPQWVDTNEHLVEQEADRVTNKARKIGTTLRKAYQALPRVDGAILLTQETSQVKRLVGREVRGVRFHSLNEWKTAIDFDASRALSPTDITRLGRVLEPKSGVAIDGSLRRLAGYVNLELHTPKAERFHRVYKGGHPARRDRVVLHLYDLSASDAKNAEAKAKREFEALHRLQINGWAPRILDSYQEVPGYAGEMYFFTVVDPAVPSIEGRATDKTWTTSSRIAFARNATRALRDLHASGTANEPVVHRNLTLSTMLVKHDNTPIFTGFEWSKIPSDISVVSNGVPAEYQATFAPEVRSQGLGAADQRSDVYSLCACLAHVFNEEADDLRRQAAAVVARGRAEQPHERDTLDALDAALGELLGELIPPPAPPPARFWTEDQIVRFRERDYRIVARLGSGGIGTTFKVVEIDRSTNEDLGTYVAKIAHDGAIGGRVIRAHSLVRSHLRHTALSTIFEVAKDWQENQFIALMTWISGAPLSDFIGVFPLLAEEQQESSSGALALRWLRMICEALDVLHRNGLVHGDVTPRNLIVSGSDLVLTDYDFVGKIGDTLGSPGTVLYCSPSYLEGRSASSSDDVYALAATFFHVLFEREPFRYGSDLDKRRGLNWEGVPRDGFSALVRWLDKATHPDASLRFASIVEAQQALAGRVLATAVAPVGSEEMPVQPHRPPEAKPEAAGLREQRVPWLLSLLQSYPGSRWGNRETRGLDTKFASQTYVNTPLEEALLRDIRERRVRLVILCGNAGDGKTALLQHLSVQLGLGRHHSSDRILEARLDDGLLVRMNLDGSASWQGQSADEILDDFLAPYQNGPPADDRVHLLAINDGRLLEWIGGVEGRGRGETSLSAELYRLVQQETPSQESHIRFVSLNQRSLVGGIDANQSRIDTVFLERLVDHLYGGTEAPRIWAPCQSCSAMDRCEVFRAARLFGPSNLAALEKDEIRQRARERLFEALQAVHLRGETHITVRELRAALVYVLFGTHFCDDFHEAQEMDVLPYWDRAFWTDSPLRQGETLAELARFDPALEAHPQIDRYLVSKPAAEATNTAPRYPRLALESARRRAFFEWTRNNLDEVAANPEALDVARGQHLGLFRNLPLESDPLVRAKVCERICAGISRLEDLPPQALDRQGVVPLRVTPHTPTETAFWVEKPLDAFRLEADLPPSAEGIERLHRHAFLVYRYRTGASERLRLGADLFHLLLELADGYQLGDVSTNDTFAHLSIFVQRLAREDERQLLAWNPMRDETLYEVSAVTTETTNGSQQRLVISPVAASGTEA